MHSTNTLKRPSWKQPVPYRSWMTNASLLSAGLVLLVVAAAGCVSSATHEATLAELADAQRQATDNRTTSAQLYHQLTETQEQKNKYYNKLMRTEEENRELGQQLQEATERHNQVRLERDALQTERDDLERKLKTATHNLVSRAQEIEEKSAHIADLMKEKQELNQTLSATQGELREATIKLDAVQAQVTDLQGDKQRLLSGTTTAQTEIARLQKRAGELETEAARGKDLEDQVAEQHQEIALLRQSLADREAVAATLETQKEEMKRTHARVDELTAELEAMSEQSAALTRERDDLAQQVATLTKSHEDAQAALAAQQAELAQVAKEKAAKEAEIELLTGTYRDLEDSLRAEIAQGDIKIKQVRDRLTINVVDRILFDSGSAAIKPDGLKVMHTVSDVLKKVTDKQIRIEGHTDNVPISARLQERFPSNWELSTARATSVVRYLIDKGGIAPEFLTAAGHADTQPVASNDTEDGRSQNRRIEIALYPKDLRELVETAAAPEVSFLSSLRSVASHRQTKGEKDILMNQMAK